MNSWHGNAPENRERDRGWNKEFSRSLRAVKATKPCPGLRCKARGASPIHAARRLSAPRTGEYPDGDGATLSA